MNLPKDWQILQIFLLWPYNTRGAMSKIHLIMIYKLIVTPFVDIVKMDALAWWKISKHHFIKDIENSFHEVTHIGLKPHQFFSFWNILTNTVARAIQSFGWNGPWLAGWLSYGQNLLVQFAQTNDEQMLIISRRSLDSCLSYS